MAASAVFSLPLIVLYLLTAKTFVRGIAMTGIKGYFHVIKSAWRAMNMESYHLIVSRPPHAENFNAVPCAACFGRTAAEVRMKANSPAPEIWMGESDKGKVGEKASLLQDHGLNCVVVSGEDLARVPWPDQAKAFSFQGQGVQWDLEGRSFVLPISQDLYIVSCRPKLPVGVLKPEAFLGAAKRGLVLGHQVAMASKGPGGVVGQVLRDASAQAEFEASKRNEKIKEQALEKAIRREMPSELAFLDLYFSREGAIERVTVVEGTVDYRPLGSLMKTTARENTKVLTEGIAQLYGQAQVDRRLENWHYKPSTLGGLNLNALLERIAPPLKEMDPYDLASRLAFLTSRFNPTFHKQSE